MIRASHRIQQLIQISILFMLIYTFTRVEYLWWNWDQFRLQSISEIAQALLIGLRFDISATMIVLIPLILVGAIPWFELLHKYWRWFVLIYLLLIQLPLLMYHTMDVEFINFVGRRFTLDTLFLIFEGQGKFWSFFFSYLPLFIIHFSLYGFFIYWVLKIFFSPMSGLEHHPQKSSYLKHAFYSFIVFLVAVIGARGGLQSKPISFVHANVFLAPSLNNLVLNTPFSIIKSIGEPKVRKETYMSEKEMLENLNGQISGESVIQQLKIKPKNVVLIILESFGKEYIGPKNQGQSFTPFLDQLMQKSLVFENSYASGRRSIEGIAAITAGIPALMNEPFISSSFMTNYFVGIGTVLQQQNYHTSFFHGGNNGTMYFDSFMKSVGIQNYFGANEYPNKNDHDGVWGIWDEEFLQWMVQKINQFPQPFFTSVFTLSSHQPYKIPEKYRDRFSDGPIEILKAVAYTDYSLQEFFKTAEKQSWYQDTLFIITADHTHKHYLPEFNNDLGDYEIPLIFFHPQVAKWPVDFDVKAPVSQIDIFPSILNYLRIENIDKNYLNRSVFIHGDRVVVDFLDGKYFLFAQNEYLVWPRGEEVRMYSITDRHQQSPIVGNSELLNKRKKQLQAAIQYFGQGMWDNKLYYPVR